MDSRVNRYSKKNRLKRRIKKLGIKGIIKILIRNIVYLIVGLVYATYLLIRAFDNLIARFFMRLPRIMKVAIIYLLVINLGFDFYRIFEDTKPIKEVVTVVSKVEAQNIPVNFNAKEQKEETCVFDSISCQIAEKGKEIGLNEEQTLISIAISKWETGNYTSSAFLNKNNVGGVMCDTGLRTYATLDEGITHFLTNLKNNYFDIGLDTLEKIKPKYCPDNAKNDPDGLNQYWLKGTNQKLIELKGK
ncbi:MAG: hypothetical protein MR598_03440 [Erysipelotrichaceae bacterium]|nr:hypothetical protein [Erysipelotrichaceae bacterium]